MDVNSRDPSQNIIPFRIKGVDVGRFDMSGNLGIGTVVPSATLEVVGTTKISGNTNIGGNVTIGGNTTITGSINISNNTTSNYSSNDAGFTVNGVSIENKTTVVVNMDSQPVAATALNRQKKQSIPLASTSTLITSDIVAKMSGVSVGKTQSYGVGPAQMASYGNIVVAVGEGTNSIAYSLVNPPTASSWIGIPNSAATFTTRGRNIAYANGTWVAVGEGTNSIAYSTITPPVASSWVGIPNNIVFNGVTTRNTFNVGWDIAYGNGAWVAVGGGTNSIAYSLANPPTAESWVGITINSSTNFGTEGYGITFGNGTWVATGFGTNGIAYSTRTPPTADSWVVVPLTNSNDAGSTNTPNNWSINVIYANGVWLVAGDTTNVMCYSLENPPIAGSWMPITTSILFGQRCRAIAYGNGTWVACGDSGTLLAYSTARIPHSSSWVSMKGPTPSSSGEQINHITFNVATNTWYFLFDIGTNCMFYSTATPPIPATWVGIQRSTGAFTTQAYGAVGITTPAFTSPINVARLDNKVTFPANRMLAVGGGGVEVLARSSDTPTPATTGTISYSDDDGATWQMVPGGATNAMFSSAADIAAGTSFGIGGSRGANAVAWNGEKWVAAGNGRTNSLAFSDDGGMTWTGITGKSIFSVEARDVAWNGRMWVAVGRGLVFSTAYSYDGITWMGPVNASGVPTNVFSFNIAGDTAAMSDISGGGIHVIWAGKMWIATGTRTLIAGSSPAAYYTVAYSLDGKSWTGVPESGTINTGFDMYAHGVAWNGRNYIVTGRGILNTLAYFTDVRSTDYGTWQGLGNTVFSVWGRGITWGAKRWMATGRGTNTVAYSTNGRNWQGCGANVFKPLRRFMAIGDTGLYTTVSSGQPQRGVAFTYSDDGITWDAPVVNQGVELNGELPLYSFTTHTFTNASARASTGPTLSAVRNAYSSASWAQNNSFLSMTSDNGIQLWTVPVSGIYTIRAVGAAGGNPGSFGRGRDIQTSTLLIKGEVIRILIGQQGITTQWSQASGGGGTFVVRGTQTPIIVAGGGGGRGSSTGNDYSNSNANSSTSGNRGGDGSGTSNGAAGTDGNGGGSGYGSGGGGLLGSAPFGNWGGGASFITGGLGGVGSTSYGGDSNGPGGFGGGGAASGGGGGGGGGGYSGGGGGTDPNWPTGGGGGSFAISTMTDNGAINTGNGLVVITLNLISSSTSSTSSSRLSSSIFTNSLIITNAVTDNASQHTAIMYSSDAGASWTRVPGTSDTEANGGTGMTIVNGGALSLTINTSRTRFLVGGGESASTTRKVYFSNDGFNWRNGISSPNSTQMAFVYASLWVGGGFNRWLIGGNDATTLANGRIMYSGDADAVSAWLAASPATYTNTIISCFAANANFSVVLAGTLSGNTILRSENGGATWTTVSISTTPTGSVNSIAFSPSLGRWIAVGGGSGAANTIIYSTDATGNTWLAIPSQAKAASTAIFKIGSEVTRVIWDAVGERFLIGGWNGGSVASLTNVSGLDSTNNNTGCTMAYSSDGVIWTPVTVRSDTATSSGLSAGASMFGPFLTQCREIMALDMSGDFTPINTGYSVSWNSYANRFIATGNGTTPVVYSSDGGVTWTPANQQPQQQAIAVAGGLGTAASTSSSSTSHITYTIDGKTWSQGIGVKEIFGTGTVLAVKYGQTSTAISPNGRIWVAGGFSTSGTSCLAFSQNGVRWTAIANGNTMITNIRAIAYAPAEQMIAVSGVNNGVNNALTTVTSGVGNGVWVAGGDTTNSLVFSYDGISWSEVPNSLTILSRCNACAFGNGLFVAGGVAATGSTAVDITANMAYSTDGINWQPIRGTIGRIASGVPINAITYGRDEKGRGIWVAGAGGSITVSLLYSYNGIDWIGVPSSGTLAANITGIANGINSSTGQSLWVASVYRISGYSFIFSTNGRDGWTAVPNTKTGLFEVNTSGANGIAYLNGVWYATGISAGVSTGRTLAYSYEGSSGWFGVYPTSNIYGSAITTFSLTDMRCVATSSEYMIPTGSSAGLTTSAGTAASSGVPSSLVPVRSLGWTAGIGSAYLQHPTLLFGSDNGLSGTVSTSISADGGRTWGSSTASIPRSAFRGGACNDAFWNGVVWAAVGYDTVTGSKVATSKDGVSWIQIPSENIPITGVLYSIMWNGTIWMVGGDGAPTDDAFTASIAWSTDLITWNAITNTDTKLTITKRIAWNGMYWVAVGSGDVSTIMHSRDPRGLIWEDTYLSTSSTNKTASIISVVNDVVWGGGRWVAVGRGNSIGGGSGVSILYSVDTPVSGGTPAEYAIGGRRWTAVAGSAQLFPYGANSISWNGKRFVATGPASGTCSTGNIIAWSADGISWNAYSTTKTVAPGQRWVAVGSGSRASIALSADGRVWTDVSGSALLFSDISGASAALVNTMKTGGRAIGWNGDSLVVGGSRSATTVTPTSQFTATSTIGRTTIPVCAFIGSGNGVMGGGTSNAPMDSTAASYIRTSSSVFITHLDVNIREGSAPWSNMWLNTYTDLSGTQLFQVTPEAHTFSSALKWNGWSWVANFGLTTNNPITGEQYGSIWYCTDPLARVGWSVASNYATPRILIGHGGYAGLEWNGVAWLACGYDPNNNNLIYTTDKYGAIGWTAVTGIVSGAGSASFQPVCIASSSRFWVVGGSQGTTSAMYYTSDRTGATGWRAIVSSVLPGIRITSIGYNGSAWVCCGGGGGGSGAPASSISWRVDADDIGTGWAAATISGTNGGFPPVLSGASAVAYNAGAESPIWLVVGDVTSNSADQIVYTSTVDGSTEWKKPSGSFTLTNTTFGRLNGVAWTGYSWIATTGAGGSRIASTFNPAAASSQWNNTTNTIFSPTLCTNAVAYVNIPISLLTTGMPTSGGSGAGTGAMWRGGVGRTQGLLPSGGTETTSVVVRSTNGAEGTRWSQVYSRNFLIAVGGGIIRDSSNDGGTNRMAYSYDGGLSWTTNNTLALTNRSNFGPGSIRTVKYGNGMWVSGGDSTNTPAGSNSIAWSRDGINWTGAGGTQIFGTNGSCYAVCCNDRGRWIAVGGAQLTTAGTYTNTSGAIYTMAWSDDGMNWTPILGSRALFGIVCQGVSYGADASGVGMWTAIGRGTTYTGCAYSYDGKNWFLSQTSGSLFGTSTNVLTERYAPVASAPWFSVCMSSNGQYQYAATQSGLVWRSIDYGVTWSASALPSRSWVSVAVSSTGQYVIAACNDGSPDRLFNSSDFGVTWISRSVANAWRQVAISASGQYQVGVSTGSSLFMSRDCGVTWFGTSNPGSTDWTCIAISSTGQYITAAGNGLAPFVSTDFGVTWTTRSSAWNWSSLAMTPDGKNQIGSSNTNNIYISGDYGVNWNVLSNAPTGARYRSVAISSTGAYISGVFESSSDTIKRQTTLGGSFTSVGVSANYFSICMSTSGQYQTAVANNGLIYISSNFGETWSSAANDSRSLGITYGKDATGAGMWVATAGRRDRDVAASAANTMAYSYDGKLWRGITAAAGLSEQAWSVAYGKDGFGVGMWVAGGYDAVCGLKWSYDGVTWNASTGASGASVWVGAAAGRRAISVYWNGTMWLASTSDTRNGEPRGTSIAANNASGVPGYLLYSYNGKNWLPVLAPNTYAATISSTAQPSIYSVLPNPVILDFGSFYDDQSQRGTMIANTTARTVGAAMSSVPIENVNTIVPYGKGSLTTGQVTFIMGGDSGLVNTIPGTNTGIVPITSELASATSSLSTSTDGGITWRAVPNSTRIMTKVNKILCDESTQQIVAVGTGNYSVATSTPATAGNADGWTGVFGSRMTDTRAGMFERFGTGASWFSGAKMWIASGRAQTRRGSSLAVSVNGTVWQDAKIVSQTTASLAGTTRGGGMVSRTTSSIATPAAGMNSEDGTPYSDGLYAFTSHTFTAASTSGATGPSLSSLRTAYSSSSWTQDTSYFNSSNGIQLWTVPATGNYTIRCVGAGVPYSFSYTSNGQNSFQRGGDGTSTFLLSRGEIIRILVGQMPDGVANSNLGGAGGSFVVRRTQDPLIVVGGGGGRGASKAVGSSDAINSTTGQNGNDSRSGNETSWPGYFYGTGGSGGNGGNQGGTTYGGSGGGLTGNGSNNTWVGQGGGIAFINGGMGGTGGSLHSNGGFGGGGGAGGGGSGAGGGGYSGGGQGALDNTGQWSSGGGGGSYSSVGFASFSVNNNSNGFVIITANFTITPTTPLYYTLPTLGGVVPSTSLAVSTSVVPYTAATTPLLTYTDSAAAFSTQVSSVAVNSQYNRAVVGGSSVQFVAGGRGANGGLAYSNGGQTWTAASTGTSAVFQTPTNVTTRTGSGGFDASFGTVALTRRLTTPITYPSGNFYTVAINETGQYQTAAINGGQIWTSSDYGVNWTARADSRSWIRNAMSSSGQYQTAVVEGANIWTSSDFGTTWTSRDSGRAWYGISISSTGQYQTAVAYGGNVIYTSSDYGVNWVGRADGRSWYSVSISSTGQYQSAVVNGGQIWASSDYGVSWSAREGNRSWMSIAISSTGQYQTAVVTSGFIYVSSDFGITWISRMNDMGRGWYIGGVSVSSTGQYQSATVNNSATNGFGFIYTSNDFGITWIARLTDANRNWGGISISGTGQYQTATVYSGTNLNNIYTSSNYGVSWVQRTTARRTNAFTRIKSSASGQYQIATSGPVGNANGQFYISSDYGQMWMPRRGLGSWLSGAVSGSGAIMIGATSQQITLPYAMYVRTGGSIWRQFVPLLPANSSDNLQSWGPDSQFNDVNSGGGNEIAMQFSYFAGYWLNVNRAVVGQSLSVLTWGSNGFLGTFTFTATSSNPVATYTGSLSGYNSTTYTLTPQIDGIAAGTSANSIPIRLSGALTYSPILYLDATNSSSYNGNTWANIGSLGGNVNMTYMGSFDSVDNGGSFNFNGSSNFGTLSVSSQTLTQATYVAVVKTNGKSGWAEILDLGNDNLFIGTGGSNVLYFYTPSTSSNYTLSPGVWYNIAFTISTSGALIFYVNGASVFSTTISTISKSGSLFGIGAGVSSTTSADEYWNGKISSLAVYNRVLTAQEISNLTSPRITIPDFWGTYGSFTSATSFTLNGFTLYSSIGTYSNEGISNLLTSGNTVAGFLGSSVTIGLTGPSAFKIDSIIWDNRGLTGSRKSKNYRFYGSNISYIGNISSALVSSTGILLASGTFSSGSSSDTVTFSNPTYYTSYYFDILDNYGDGSIKVSGITINSGAPSNTALLNTSNTIQSNGFSLVRSTDYGTTFNDISGTTVAHPAYWRAISTTNSASNQTAVAYGGSIYRSSDTGATWSNTGITIDGSVNANTTARNWQDVAVSAETGAVQVTCVSGGYLYVSSNTGATWDSSGIVIDGSGSQLANRSWQALALSANGQYGLACVNSLTASGFLYRSINSGATWSSSDISINGVGTQTTNRSWQDVGMSGNGKYQVAAASLPGMLSTAPIFNGTTNRINFGNQLAWNNILTNITVECWFRTSDTNNQNTFSTLVSRWVNGSTSDSQFRLGMDSGSNGRIVFNVISNTSNNGLSVTSPLPYNDTSWYHVAGTYSSSTGVITLYINGILVTSSTNASLGQLAVNTTPLMIGSDNRDLTDRYFRGSISEVRIWNVARSPSQIANSFQSRLVGNESGLAAYFRLDQSTAIGFPSTVTGFQDSSPNSNNSSSISFSPLTWFISSEILFSKNYGASWSSLSAAGFRAWSSVSLSENGSTISATTNDTAGAIWTYTMPDDQYYLPAVLANSGSTTTASTVRAVAYGNSGTGAALDGYWVAGADASANTLAYSTNGIDWTAVVGSKTTLFNTVNSVAYGVDTSGTPMWVAVGLPFVGSIVGSTAFSIGYSYNMTTWVGVRNATNFTGQGNHVAYGQDEFGSGMWVAVGQGDGALSANLGDSALYNSNGTTNTTIFYSYDGANWAAATGAGVFSTSGTDVTWGVDASGVATWVATGVGYTDPLTGIFTPGGQVAHSVNGRVWAPIRAPTAITPALSATTLPDTTRGSTMVAPPASTGFVTPTTNNIWRMLGGDIDGEAPDDYSGYSVSMSADGTIVAIGATHNDGAASNAGHVRVYKYNPNKTVAQMNQSLPGFGPAGWDRLGADIDGEAASEQSLYSRNAVILSADGTTVAIGSNLNDGNGSNSGHVRVYRYTPSKTVAVTTQTDASFGPIGWNRLGADIDGEAANDESGWSVGLSADGNIVAIGAWGNDGTASDAGHVRVYKYTPSKTVAVTNQTDASFGPIGWNRLGADIDGEAIDDRSGTGLAISADGTTIAIGAHLNDGTSARTDDGRGQVRVYKYNSSKTTAQTNQTLPNFGPIGWNRLGEDIDDDEYLYENYGPITLPTYNVLNFPVLNTIPNWEIDISFTSTNRNNDWRGLIGSMRNSVDPIRGWGIWISTSNGIHYCHNNSNALYDSFNGSVSLNTPYNLNVTRISTTIHLRLVNLSTQAILTNSFSVTDPLGVGPVSIGGWPGSPQETFGGTISYVKVLTFFQSQSGVSVSLSADGNILAIGGQNNDGNGLDSGHVRVYKYNSSKVLANTLGPSGWDRLGGDIDGEAPYDYAGNSVSLSADGTVIAIGAANNDGPTGGDRGHVRVYKYNPSKNTAITNQSLPNFGPIGWDRIGVDIDGEAPSNYSGYSVSLSADGTTLAIGAVYNDGAGNDAGQVRVYKLDTFGAITYTSSNPSVAEIYGNTLIFIKEGASGTTTITATQAATPPFILTPITVQGTLTVSGTTYTLQYNSIMTTFTPFTGPGASALTVAYGRAGSQGTGAPLWIVGGSGGNVFARSSRPSAFTANTWTFDASNAVSVPFPVCNSLGYSNGVWVAGNNTNTTNILARSVDGGVTWVPVTASSMSSILTGAAAVGMNTSCNYSLAYADYSNDTNLRSWIAVQGTKNFFFEGGVSAVATVTPDINAAAYGSSGTRAWWIAGGVGLSGTASIGYTTDPNGATGWTYATSASIANLASINTIAFSPFTQQWVAMGAGATGSPNTNILISDINGATWTATSVATAATPVITLNTCIWNQLPTPTTVSSAGRWLAGGTRNDGGVNNVSVANSASVYMSTNASGSASPWTPIIGTGAILSQVYSLAYNGRVWIAAGVPATDGGSTSTLMRTTDPSGASGWVGIATTNTSVGGFDTAARSITWNADQQMWVATGENTATTGSGGAVDASFSSLIYSLDVSGGPGTWRSVRESNSICFSGEGTGIAFTGDKWFAAGEGNKQIVATTGTNAATAATASWSTVSHATTLTRASDITYTGRRLIATGSGAGSTSGVILSTDNTGASWSAGPSTGFSDSNGGGTSVNFEASYDGVGRVVATGRSDTNTLSVSTDGGSTWSAPTVQFSSTNTVDTPSQTLFTTGGNSVSYVGNDTLFAVGGNDIHWTGKRWVAVGRNSANTVSSTATMTTITTPDVINNNTIPVATSEDGMMWQCVRASQGPNLSDGTFLATNSRIGSTPLIDSEIIITDGGDTESNIDYGGMTCGIGGSGTGVTAIDIISELTPSSLAASSIGAVGIIGAAGNGGANNVGHAPIASFDTTAFTITTRPTTI